MRRDDLFGGDLQQNEVQNEKMAFELQKAPLASLRYRRRNDVVALGLPEG